MFKINKIEDVIQSLKEIMESNSITQKKLSEHMGVSPMSVSKTLSSKKGPSLLSLIKILDLLGYKLMIVSKTESLNSIDPSQKFYNSYMVAIDEIETKFKKEATKNLNQKELEIKKKLQEITLKGINEKV